MARWEYSGKIEFDINDLINAINACKQHNGMYEGTQPPPLKEYAVLNVEKWEDESIDLAWSSKHGFRSGRVSDLSEKNIFNQANPTAYEKFLQCFDVSNAVIIK
jgi:hypothetical protein